MENLKNKYFALRHGESKANVAELIVSNLADAINEAYSLTPKGEEQVRESVSMAKGQVLLTSEAMIYSSPFSRCRKSAEIAKELLGSKKEIIIDDRLRERWFGKLDKTSTENYQKVWNRDKDSGGAKEDEEPAEEVKERTMSLVQELEKTNEGKTFLLVSHGDVLQILEAWVRGMVASKHRDIKPLERGELRELT